MFMTGVLCTVCGAQVYSDYVQMSVISILYTAVICPHLFSPYRYLNLVCQVLNLLSVQEKTFPGY